MDAVENFEKGSRAQLSREVEFSLPCELDADERLKAARTLAFQKVRTGFQNWMR